MHNLVDMVVFAKVVQLQTFSAAAEELDMSQSVVSKHVTRLERMLGVRLLNRTTRRLSLTDAGHAVLTHCVRISKEAEASELVASTFSAQPRGLLRLGSPGAFGRLHIAPAIPEFLARYPELNIEMVMGDRFVDLINERFDVAISSELIPGASLITRKLAPIRWVVCATEAYLHRHGTPKMPADLEHHNCIYFSSAVTPGHVWRFRKETVETMVCVKGNFRVNNTEAVREVAMRGLGIALLPTFVLGPKLETQSLRVLLDDHVAVGTFGTHIYAHHVSGVLVPPKVRACVDFFSDHFRDKTYWNGPQPRKSQRGKPASS